MTEKMSRTSYHRAPTWRFTLTHSKRFFHCSWSWNYQLLEVLWCAKLLIPAQTYIVIIVLLVLILIRSIISVRMFLWQMFVVEVLISTHSRRSSSRLRFFWGLWMRAYQIRCEFSDIKRIFWMVLIQIIFFHRNVVDALRTSRVARFLLLFDNVNLELQSR